MNTSEDRIDSLWSELEKLSESDPTIYAAFTAFNYRPTRREDAMRQVRNPYQMMEMLLLIAVTQSKEKNVYREKVYDMMRCMPAKQLIITE